MKRKVKTDINDEKVNASLDVLEDILKHPERYEHVPGGSEIHPIAAGRQVSVAVKKPKR